LMDAKDKNSTLRALSRLILPFVMLLGAVLLNIAPCPVQAQENTEIKIKFFEILEGRIAFTYQKGPSKDIWVLDFGKLTTSPLIQTPKDDEYPAWSPDGTLIAYQSDASGDTEIYMANYDGTEVKQLTSSKGADEYPSWSPDGKELVFSSERGGMGSSNIYTMKADGSGVEALTKSQKKNALPRWSPRGTEILFTTDAYWPGYDLIIYDIGAKTQKTLTEGKKYCWQASWSPDGSAFVYSSGERKEMDIYLRKKDGTMETLAKRPGRDYDPLWTDDGKFVFFVGELNQGKGDFELFAIKMKTKELVQVTESKGAIRHPTWTPFPSLDTLAEEIRTGKKKQRGR